MRVIENNKESVRRKKNILDHREKSWGWKKKTENKITGMIKK